MSVVFVNLEMLFYHISCLVILFFPFFLGFLAILEKNAYLRTKNPGMMKYRIKKETKPTLLTYGKYKAVAVHNQTIESRQIYEEAARHMSLSGGVLEGLMMEVASVVRRHLREGDKVRLKDFGLLKLEIESEKVDNLKDFRAKKHIRGVRLHFIPESDGGSPELYKDIHFERDKD